MGELAIQNLHGNGATKVTVINRTFEKAQTLARTFQRRREINSELQTALNGS